MSINTKDSFTAKDTKETKVTKVTKPLTPTQNDMITFRSKRYANGTDQCASDIPSAVYDYSQLQESSVGPVGVPGSVLCAWKCKTDESCISFNWKSDRQLCELFFNVVASCHFVTGCAFHESPTGQSSCHVSICTGTFLVHQNLDRSNYFKKSWQEFKDGFGDAANNFWIGNEKLYQLTNISCNCSLHVNVQQSSLGVGGTQGETYSPFSVSSEANGYALNIGNGAGSISDALLENKGKMFSTYDRDNDDNKASSCAAILGFGWWYGTRANCADASLHCGTANLNGNSTFHLWIPMFCTVPSLFAPAQSSMAMTCTDKRT